MRKIYEFLKLKYVYNIANQLKMCQVVSLIAVSFL